MRFYIFAKKHHFEAQINQIGVKGILIISILMNFSIFSLYSQRYTICVTIQRMAKMR